MSISPPLVDAVDAFNDPSFGGVFLNPLVDMFGADPTGVVPSTQAFINYELSFSDAVYNGGGGLIEIPAGVFIVNGWTSTRTNITIRGAGMFATTLKASTPGSFVLRILGPTGGPRWHLSDLCIDANGLRDCGLSLGETGICTTNTFDNVYVTGAAVDTVRLGGIGQSFDVSMNGFTNCHLDSPSPSNSNLRVAGSNTAQNYVTGGTIGPNGSFPQNVDFREGAVIFTGVYFFGSTQYDFKVGGGAVKIKGGNSESAAGFFHTLSTDLNGHNYPPHSIEDFIIGSNAGASTDVSVFHEANRTLYMRNVSSNKSVHVGSQGSIIRQGLKFFSAGATLSFDAGAQIGGLPMTKIFKSIDQSIPNATETEVEFDFESIDTLGGHDNVTNNSHWTAPAGFAGWVRVRCQIDFAGSATGSRQAVLKMNGLYTGARGSHTGNAIENIFLIEDELFVADGDVITLHVTQDTGGALELRGGGLSFTSLTVYCIGMNG